MPRALRPRKLKILPQTSQVRSRRGKGERPLCGRCEGQVCTRGAAVPGLLSSGGSPPRSRCPGRDPPVLRGRAPRGGDPGGTENDKKDEDLAGQGRTGGALRVSTKRRGNGLLLPAGVTGQETGFDGRGEISRPQLFWPQITVVPGQNLSGWRLPWTKGSSGGPRGVPCPGPCSTSVTPRGGCRDGDPQGSLSPGWGHGDVPPGRPPARQEAPDSAGEHRLAGPLLSDTDWLSFTSTTPDWLRPPQTSRVPPLQEAVGAPGPAC